MADPAKPKSVSIIISLKKAENFLKNKLIKWVHELSI